MQTSTISAGKLRPSFITPHSRPSCSWICESNALNASDTPFCSRRAWMRCAVDWKAASGNIQPAPSAIVVLTPAAHSSSTSLMPVIEAPTTSAVRTGRPASARLSRSASAAVRMGMTPGRSCPGIGGTNAEAPVEIRILS